jgi:23S rRNA pseudouridine1911/1915/1917 synthase
MNRLRPATRRVSATFSHNAAPNEGGVSFLDLLLRRFPYHTPAEWRERILSGRVTLEGRAAAPETVVKPRMRLEYRVDDYDEPAVPVDFREILREGDLALVHKPAGLPVHKTGKIFVNVLANLYRAERGDDAWSPLNRLDVETGGIVAFARGPEALRRFSPVEPETHWTKTYLAVVAGTVAEAGTVEAPLGESPGDPIRSRMHVLAEEAGGKPATTRYRPLLTRDDKTLLLVRPLTGRKHQIRAHLASLGHPVIGDKMYGLGGRYYLKRLEGELDADDLSALQAPHQLLHALSLEIRDAEGRGIAGSDFDLPEGFRRFFPEATEEFLTAALTPAPF